MKKQLYKLSIEAWNLECDVFDLWAEADRAMRAWEDKTDKTQDIVLECEGVYDLEPNEITGQALDEAYSTHEQAMQELHKAQERLDYIKQAMEALERAHQYLAWAE